MNLSTRTEIRIASKNSINFKVKVNKTVFTKKTLEDGKLFFEMKNLEDPKNPRKSHIVESESKFITLIMNKVYYQTEKGFKNNVSVLLRTPIAELENGEVVVEEKPKAKPKAKAAPKAKAKPKAKK